MLFKLLLLPGCCGLLLSILLFRLDEDGTWEVPLLRFVEEIETFD